MARRDKKKHSEPEQTAQTGLPAEGAETRAQQEEPGVQAETQTPPPEEARQEAAQEGAAAEAVAEAETEAKSEAKSEAKAAPDEAAETAQETQTAAVAELRAEAGADRALLLEQLQKLEQREARRLQEAETQQQNMEKLLKRLDRVEGLLQLQTRQNKKVGRSKAVQTFLLLCLVVVFGIGLFSLNVTVNTATKDIPKLVQDADKMVQETSGQLEVILQDIRSVDFESLNNTIHGLEEGVNSVDFEAMNDSILELQQVVESLARVTSLFR